MKDEKLENILNLIDDYIKEKHSKKTWTPGKDWVRYSGPFFDSKEYINALSNLKRMSQNLVIDRVMDENLLDAIIAPTGSPAWTTDWINGDNYHISSSSPAAWAGYPNISVPMGNIHGLPVGLSFFGRAWSEPTLIEICYGFEQATKARITPTFRINDEK